MKDHIVGLAIHKQSEEKSQNIYHRPELLDKLIREALLEAGLGKKDTSAPLKDIIQPEMRVLLKPNWVLHKNLSPNGMDCMITHPNFILSVLQEVLKTRPRKIIIGDAPIQSADFKGLISTDFKKSVLDLAGKCPIEIIDFRMTTWVNRDDKITIESNARSFEEYVQFDLGSYSLLDDISNKPSSFRCTAYDPRETAKRHGKGVHQYLICKEAFKADVILNLPKLKTHKKAGITAALKNIVGLIGSKAYLPHHRVGGDLLEGDCYPGIAPFKRIAEFFCDQANKNLENCRNRVWSKAGKCMMKMHRLFSSDMELEGGWFGNDTVWRMTVDINRLLLYGRIDGSMAEKPIRNVYSFTDAIIAGEGFGPLAPEPVELNAVTFSKSSAFADLCHTALMGFDWEKIPLVRGAFANFSYPLTKARPGSIEIHYQGRILSLREVSHRLKQNFKPPQGWVGYIEL